VEQWAELRREHFVRGVSINELVKRTGLARNTIRAALRSAQPPRYSRRARGSKLDLFKADIQRLLGEDPALPGVRVGELLEPLGWSGGKTILDDNLREIRPLFVAARTTRRIVVRTRDTILCDLRAVRTVRRIVRVPGGSNLLWRDHARAPRAGIPICARSGAACVVRRCSSAPASCSSSCLPPSASITETAPRR